MRLTSICVSILCLLTFTQIGNSQEYSRVRIDLRSTTIETLESLGLEVEHGTHIPHRYLSNDFSASEIALLKANNISYDITIADVKAHYRNQNTEAPVDFRGGHCENDSDAPSIVDKYKTPNNYTFGSMGGYATYEEMLATFADMHAKYPQYISELIEIPGIRTQEDRPLYYCKLSDNPNTEEGQIEQQMLYTALHHAREPNSLSQMIFYIWYLLENSETDPQLKYIIDNTELYFMPCVNPDGYVYNHTTDPNGGGLWRKNRRVNADGNTRGVDLNRNYGYFWAFDNQGSSPNPGSDTYRGESGFSEPETQAVKWLCEQHNFQIALNYHCYSNLLIHPWGYNDEITEEDILFKGMARLMVDENNYKIGTGVETVGYLVNGDSDDYMYGDNELKNKIYAMTPEVGPGFYGFWPPQSAIDQLNKESLLLNINAANLLHYYLTLTVDKQAPLTSTSGLLSLELSRFGLKDGTATISLFTESTELNISSEVFPVELDILASQTFDFAYTLTPEPSTQKKTYTIYTKIDYSDGYTKIDSFERNYDNTIYQVLLANAGDDVSELTKTGTWNTTTEDYVSTPSSITDSPNTDYQGNVNSTITTAELDLTAATTAQVTFWAKWDIEDDYDYVQLQAIGEDNIPTPLCGLFTNLGSVEQDSGEPLYDGQSNWVFEQVDLSDFVGQKVKLRFRFRSDGFVEGDGFYFDDLLVKVDSLYVSSNLDFALDAIELTAAPNPGSEILNLSYKSVGRQCSLHILNQVGQTIESVTPEAIDGTISINTSAYQSGIYTIQLLGDDGKILSTEKWVKM
jgi:carboxypeptidase T